MEKIPFHIDLFILFIFLTFRRNRKMNKRERTSDTEEEKEISSPNAKTPRLTYSTPTIHPDSQTQDWYAVLGVSSGCNQSDIKKAYRSLCRLYHPDKNYGANNQELEEATARLVDVQTAYKILGSIETRQRYSIMVQQEQDMRHLLEDPEGEETGRWNLDERVEGEPDMCVVHFVAQDKTPMMRYNVTREQVRSGYVKDTISVRYKRICKLCDGVGCDKSKGMKTKLCEECEGTGKINKTYYGIGKDVEDRVLVFRCMACMSIGRVRDVEPCECCNGTRFEPVKERPVKLNANIRGWPMVAKVIPSNCKCSPVYVKFIYPYQRKDKINTKDQA